MADTAYVVTAPYVTLKVKDANGAWVLRGVYRDAQFAEADIDPESLQHHLDSGLVEAVEQPKPAAESKPAAAGGSKASTKSS